jgi:hypothetical protein
MGQVFKINSTVGQTLHKDHAFHQRLLLALETDAFMQIGVQC